MNMRLGTKELEIPELEIEAGKIGKTLFEVMAVVEKEFWSYSDGYSYVCSSFVMAEYLAAGVFGNLKVEATEFTPRDVYELEIFDR